MIRRIKNNKFKGCNCRMNKPFRKFKRIIKDFFVIQRQKRILSEFLKNSNSKKILLISHQLTTTGSPLMLYHLSKELIKNGFKPLIVSYNGGSLTKSFEEIGVPVLIGEVYSDNQQVLKDLAMNFDKVIVNSIVCFTAIDAINDAIWWIHEGQSIETGFMKDYPELESVLRKAKNIFAVSEYAQNVINKYNPNSQIIKLGVEDFCKKNANKKLKAGEKEGVKEGKNDKVKFAIVGDVCNCKGQDILVDSINKLDKNLLDQSEFHFFCEKNGRRYRKIVKYTKNLKNVFFDGLIFNQEQKWETFSDMDVFIVPSRDESCSLVTLEACMLKKPVILSENVGAKYMIQEGENGYIVQTANSEQFKNAIEKTILNKNNLPQMGETSRKQYEKLATFEKHIEELQKLIDLCKT